MQTSTLMPAIAMVVNETGIAWSSDVSKKFGDDQIVNFNVQPGTRGGGTVTGECSSALRDFGNENSALIWWTCKC